MPKFLPLAVAGIVWLLSSASSSAQVLVVDVATDYSAATEFARVRVELVDRADERRTWVSYHTVSASGDYVRGVRIAEIGNVHAGNYFLVVTLLDSQLRPVAGRLSAYQASGSNVVVRVPIARP